MGLKSFYGEKIMHKGNLRGESFKVSCFPQILAEKVADQRRFFFSSAGISGKSF